MQSFKYPMNIVVKDKVSGFEGLIINRAAHISGCAQYGVAPQTLSSDHATKATEHFDENRLEVLNDAEAVRGEDTHEKIFAIPLGTEVQDKVTGFKGRAVIAIEQLYNCNSYAVQPSIDKDGKIPESFWFDEGRLDIKGEGIKPEDIAQPKRGSVTSRDLPKIR